MTRKNLILFFLIIGLITGISIIKNNILPPGKYAGNTTAGNTGLSYDPAVYSPSQLEELLKKQKDTYAVIDVRTRLEYDKGHIPGAIHADYFDIEMLKKVSGNKIPVTYDAFSAMRAPYAAYLLYLAGYKNASVLTGGLSAWAEDIETLDSKDPRIKTIFNHPKNIFPERTKGTYPPDQGNIEFTITATKFQFTPNQIIVKHGQKVTLHITSLDAIHGFAMPEFEIEEELLPKETKTITFIADRKGNFPFVCNVICGHKHASMVGNVIVQ